MHKKIIVTKEDTVSAVVGQIAADDARVITVIIPKFSPFAEDPAALKKLKKVADAMDKEVTIESVDDAVLVHAKDAGITATNPFFDGPQDDGEGGADDDGDDTMPAVVATPVVNKIRRAPKKVIRWDEDEGDDDLVPKKRGMLRNKCVWLLILIAIAIPAYWVAFAILPKAEITITTKKTPWPYNNLVTIEKNGAVPSYPITKKKNAQMSFPAHGRKMVSQKATGMITVYNGYSSKPQQLVATTRFATDGGIIVRLTKNITIPGAKIESGTITPSSIEAEVIADKPGADYNIGPIQKLTIPGFTGTPKFAGFYGELKKSLTGGFTGETAYPTDADITDAKAKIKKVLEDSLVAELGSDESSKPYIVPAGARQVTLTKAEAMSQVNAKGEFTVSGEAELKAVGFKESDLVAYLAGKMKTELGNSEYVFKETILSYESAKTDFAAQKMSLPVDMKAVAEQPVVLGDLRQKVLGKSASELKAILLAVPGIEKAEVVLWPGYITHIPNDPSPEKVKFTIQ